MTQEGEQRPPWEGQEAPISDRAQEILDRLANDLEYQSNLDDQLDRAALSFLDDPRLHPEVRARLQKKLEDDPNFANPNQPRKPFIPRTQSPDGH